MLPVYGALHTIPPILFRSKAFRKNPSAVLTKSFLGTLRSCSFLASFVVLFQGLVCSQRNIYYAIHGKVPAWIETLLMHKGYYWVSGDLLAHTVTLAPSFADDHTVGFLTCLPLLIEEKKRRGELAM